MNLATLKALIIRELHQDVATVSTTVQNDVTIAIIEAIRHHRKTPYYFNTGRYITETVPNQYYIDLPKNFLGILGTVYYTPNYAASSAFDSVTSGSRYPMVDASVDMIEEYRLKGTDYANESILGRSMLYAIDTSGQPVRMLLSPVPSERDVIDFRMIYDLGTPEMVYSAGTWNFYEPGTETVISEDTFTNDWLKLATDLIKYRALYTLLTGTYGGSDESQNMALQAAAKWTEAKNRLAGETNRMKSTNTIRKWI